MSGLLGKKIGMTSLFDADGKQIPCTVIEAGPCVVTQVKTKEKDGYDAIQLGFGEQKESRTTKPMRGHFAKAGTTPKRYVAEFSRFEEGHKKKFGEVLTVNVFQEGEFVDVVGTSKGKGFQGVVTRHGFGEVAAHGLVRAALLLLAEGKLDGLVAVLLDCSHLCDHTRTSFNHCARNLLSVGIKKTGHSDFLSD